MKQNCVTFANDHMFFCDRSSFPKVWLSNKMNLQRQENEAGLPVGSLCWVSKPLYVHHVTVLRRKAALQGQLVLMQFLAALHGVCSTHGFTEVRHTVPAWSPDPILKSVHSLHSHGTLLKSFSKLSKI